MFWMLFTLKYLIHKFQNLILKNPEMLIFIKYL